LSSQPNATNIQQQGDAIRFWFKNVQQVTAFV